MNNETDIRITVVAARCTAGDGRGYYLPMMMYNNKEMQYSLAYGEDLPDLQQAFPCFYKRMGGLRMTSLSITPEDIERWQSILKTVSGAIPTYFASLVYPGHVTKKEAELMAASHDPARPEYLQYFLGFKEDTLDLCVVCDDEIYDPKDIDFDRACLMVPVMRIDRLEQIRPFYRESPGEVADYGLWRAARRTIAAKGFSRKVLSLRVEDAKGQPVYIPVQTTYSALDGNPAHDSYVLSALWEEDLEAAEIENLKDSTDPMGYVDVPASAHTMITEATARNRVIPVACSDLSWSARTTQNVHFEKLWKEIDQSCRAGRVQKEQGYIGGFNEDGEAVSLDRSGMVHAHKFLAKPDEGWFVICRENNLKPFDESCFERFDESTLSLAA